MSVEPEAPGKLNAENPPSAIRATAERIGVELSAELNRLNGQFLDQFADALAWQTQVALLEGNCVSMLDLVAESLLPFSVSADPAAINPIYQQVLERIIEGKIFPFFSGATKPLRADLRDDATSRITLKLDACKLKWLAHAKSLHLLHHSTAEQPKAKPRVGNLYAHLIDIRDFSLSLDYRSLVFRGQSYKLTRQQGQIVKILWDAYECKQFEVSGDLLKKQLNCGKIGDSFRSKDGPKLWNNLVVSTHKGFYKLNLDSNR